MANTTQKGREYKSSKEKRKNFKLIKREEEKLQTLIKREEGNQTEKHISVLTYGRIKTPQKDQKTQKHTIESANT